jgi:AcrR family transcriptional regulator
MTQSGTAAHLPGDDSARKGELVQKLLAYSAEHGLSSMSLRPLAAAVGSSPRMLLYFFGSKEGLIREMLIRSRENQYQLVERWLAEASSPADRIERLWQWLADPEHAGVERLFFESYARSLHDEGGAWAGFGQTSVSDWLPFINRMLTAMAERPGSDADPMPTLVLASVRGLLLDLLATRDSARVGRAFGVLADLVRREAEDAG